MSGVHLCRSLAVPFSAIAGHCCFGLKDVHHSALPGFSGCPGELAGLDVCGMSETHWHSWGNTRERERQKPNASTYRGVKLSVWETAL